MAFFLSITETRLRRMLMVFFALGSLFPVVLTLIVVYQYVLPVLDPGQIERLRNVFNNGLLAILLIQLLSFVLFWSWIKSWETLKKRIALISAEILKKKAGADFGESELQALQRLFEELQEEFQSIASRLSTYFRRSITDDLTSVFNRTYFRFKLTDEMRRARQHGQTLSLVMFSVDDFGNYSDETGDHLLQALGRFLQRQVRKTDLPFRCGRNRFAILMPGCSRRVARLLAEKLAAAVENHSFSDPRDLQLGKVTVCCGVASDAETAEALAKSAEEALDRARILGRGRVMAAEDDPASSPL
jgi:diguanylate cyclase (GGDEF)-like protein